MSLEAFKTQVLPVKEKLYRFAFRLVGDREEAQDIVQEVFIKVWNNLEDMNDLDNVEAWCMRVTKNLSLDKLKSKKRKITDSININMDVSMGEKSTPYRSAEWNDTMKNIRSYMSKLPDKQRQIMQLRDVDGYSYKEIGDILEIDLNQVKVNLFRARKSVRGHLLNANAYGL